MSLAESLERAATELESLADGIRPANGDPHRLLEELEREQAGRLLAWILENETEVADELVAAWGETEPGTAILMALPLTHLSKPARKIMRKAHHRLRSSGVEIAIEAAPERPRRVVGGEDHWQAAHLSAPDFRGTRMGYLADPHPSGGARLFEIRFDEGRGVLDFRVYNAGRSKVRGFLRSLTAGSDQRLFEVDRKALCALVRRASLAQPVDRPLPTAFVEWRGRLFPESLEKQATPGELARSALGADGGPPEDALERVVGEIAAGRMGPWPPPTAWLSDRMEQAREAVGPLEGEARDAAIDAWLEELGASLGELSDRGLSGRHLEELGWVRWQSGDEEEARALIGAADAIGRGDEAWARLTRARAEAIVAPFVAELRGAAGDSGSDPEGAG
ncbi:MAG: hypothetical protein JRG86_09305 [Deltaproteobacteria bacterium]|jgi:hypothetical protein|nr:hypothetical protein [Deltaproteobacteria bacterium]